MDLNEAKTLTLDKMREHGLHDWSFKFSRSLSLFGQCSYSTKTIKLSQPLTEVNTVDHVTDTILHEIAHALVGPGQGHGSLWKRTAIQLGATPRAATHGVSAPSRYFAMHTCGQVYRRNRLSASKTYCTICLRHGMDYGDETVLIWERRDNGMLALTAHIAA